MKIISNAQHNPYCKMIETSESTPDGYVDLTYSETNEGTEGGLEAYYYKSSDDFHHYSRRWDFDKVPKKYKDVALKLKAYIDSCMPGYKIILT